MALKRSFRPTAEHNNNRLGPGQSIDTLRFRVRPPAADHVVAIAVRAQTSTSSLDFSYLEQPDLPPARRDNRGAPAGNSPLGRLLERAARRVLAPRVVSAAQICTAMPCAC